MKSTPCLIALAALLAGAASAHATSVSITLGQSTNNFELDGLGNNGMNYGTYNVQLGPCSGGTCDLTGAYSSSSAYGDGTYSLITNYPGSSVPMGTSEDPAGGTFQDSFTYGYVAPGTTITLQLDESGGGVFDIPIYDDNNWVVGAGFGIGFDSATCANLPNNVACSQINVGLNAGSSISGPVSGSATFDTSLVTTTPEPGTLTLLGSGLVGLASFIRRRRSA